MTVLATEQAPSATTRPPLGSRWWHRLHFAWAVLWVGPLTAVGSVLLIAAYLVRPGARTQHWWLSRWAHLCLRGLSIRLEVEGTDALKPGEPVVFVANHQNALDIVTTAAGLPVPFGFAAKAALRTTPFVGWVLRQTACVFVSSASPREAIRTMREAAGHVRAGLPILLFAEGERSYRDALLPFKRGAFLLAVEAGVPIVPVTVVGNAAVVNERRRVSRPGTVRLVIGEPVPTSACSRREVPTLIETVRSRIAGTLREGRHRDLLHEPATDEP